jgi:hypothetical protein
MDIGEDDRVGARDGGVELRWMKTPDLRWNFSEQRNRGTARATLVYKQAGRQATDRDGVRGARTELVRRFGVGEKGSRSQEKNRRRGTVVKAAMSCGARAHGRASGKLRRSGD